MSSAALDVAEGMRRDLAARNRTVQVLARKITRLRQLHPVSGKCSECKTPAPCLTRCVIDEAAGAG